ncbi:MAG: HAMP domain-containing histidine kinase [Oscillospiraceae bacterium]|nr:HAMP domain-containing histidine kinase [Oscillospiraceae bacterium]
MIEKCRLASLEIASLDALNKNTVAAAVSEFENFNVTRLIITDSSGKAIYDSQPNYTDATYYTIFPEIIAALNANDVFYWKVENGAMLSRAATPVYAYDTLIGCVYMTEHDSVQGTLISTLQYSMLGITAALEVLVILFSIFFSNTYSRRMRKIMSSIRTVRTGDYSHKLKISGNDELNSLSNEFNDLIDRLQTSENKRSQFVSDASHELKTPLASIKLLSDSILQNNMDITTIKEFVGDIGKEADRLNRMSQKLLSLSKTEIQTECSREISYIAPIIERVIRMLSENARNNNISIIKNLDSDCPIQIPEDDLSQIIFNLLENGIKYNRKNGKLEIILRQVDGNAILTIIDTGIGIPEEALSHIFERFYRVDKARSRSTGGSGLGLSIVRNMVEKNKGKISVSSTVGVGTTFTLSFPIFYAEEDTK